MAHFGSSTPVACDWIDRWVFQGISDAIKFIGKGDTNAVAFRENTAGKWMPLQLLLRWNARGVGGWRQRREECSPLLLDALQGVAVHSHKTKPCTDGCLDSRSPQVASLFAAAIGGGPSGGLDSKTLYPSPSGSQEDALEDFRIQQRTTPALTQQF